MDLSDLPRIRGPLKYVGYIGVLVMMGGLGAFAFGLLSMFANFGQDNIPRGFPPIAIYGFGVAAVGAILVTIALALGEKDDDVNIYTGPVFGDYTDVKGSIITARTDRSTPRHTTSYTTSGNTSTRSPDPSVGCRRAGQGAARRPPSERSTTQLSGRIPTISQMRLGT